MSFFPGLKRSTTINFSLCDLDAIGRPAPSLDSRAAAVAREVFKMTHFTRNTDLRTKSSIKANKPRRKDIQPSDVLRIIERNKIEKMMKADLSKGAVPLSAETTSKEGELDSFVPEVSRKKIDEFLADLLGEDS